MYISLQPDRAYVIYVIAGTSQPVLDQQLLLTPKRHECCTLLSECTSCHPLIHTGTKISGFQGLEDFHSVKQQNLCCGSWLTLDYAMHLPVVLCLQCVSWACGGQGLLVHWLPSSNAALLSLAARNGSNTQGSIVHDDRKTDMRVDIPWRLLSTLVYWTSMSIPFCMKQWGYLIV